MQIHYALQTCDIKFNTTSASKRYAKVPKQELIRKCVTSFLVSVQYASKLLPKDVHTIAILDDHSSESTIKFLKKAIKHFKSKNVKIELIHLEKRGIMNSIRSCYEWLENNGHHIVYQVQDDYLFHPTAIYQMILMYNQMWTKTAQEHIVVPYNYAYIWDDYLTFTTMVVHGISNLWLSVYHTTCSFMTGKTQFSRHWDLYEKFFNLDPSSDILESITLNKIMVDRGVLCMVPFESIALHVQGYREKDPYINWSEWWNAVPNIMQIQDNEEILEVEESPTKTSLEEKISQLLDTDKKTVLNVGAGYSKLVRSDLFPKYKEIRLDSVAPADIAGDLTDLSSFPPESIDAVWACHVLEHIYWPDIPKAFNSIMRVLKKDGMGVIIVPNIGVIGDKIRDGMLTTLYSVNTFDIAPVDMLYGHRRTFDTLDPAAREANLHKTAYTLQSMIAILNSLRIRGYAIEKGYELKVLLVKDMPEDRARRILNII